jgi:hypothetical protein
MGGRTVHLGERGGGGRGDRVRVVVRFGIQAPQEYILAILHHLHQRSIHSVERKGLTSRASFWFANTSTLPSSDPPAQRSTLLNARPTGDSEEHPQRTSTTPLSSNSRWILTNASAALKSTPTIEMSLDDEGRGEEDVPGTMEKSRTRNRIGL